MTGMRVPRRTGNEAPVSTYPLSVAEFWDRLTGGQSAPPGLGDRRQRRRRPADRGQPPAVAADPDRDHDRARERPRGGLAAVRAPARGDPAARRHLGRDGLPGPGQRSRHRGHRAGRLRDAAAARRGRGGAARRRPGHPAADAAAGPAGGDAADGPQLVRRPRGTADRRGRGRGHRAGRPRAARRRSATRSAWFLLFGGVRPVFELARSRRTRAPPGPPAAGPAARGAPAGGLPDPPIPTPTSSAG